MSYLFTVVTSRGLEEALATELRQAGLQRVVIDRGAVHFRGPLKDGYRACLWSRVGSRVLLRLHRTQGSTAQELYESVQAINWHDHMQPNGTLWIDFIGRSKHLRHSQFGARKAKDAIADQFRARFQQRPSVQKFNPDLRIHIHLRSGVFTISIDLCGAPLHLRSNNRLQVKAPLKESLAAAILQIAEWPKASRKQLPFFDPMCGSGTLLIEAAHMAQDRAPNLFRKDWAFLRWKGHTVSEWKGLLSEAEERYQEGIKRPLLCSGSDIDGQSIHSTRHNLKLAKLSNIKVIQQSLEEANPVGSTPGYLITNPPYGERLDQHEELQPLYKRLGDIFRQRFLGWNCFVLTTPACGKWVGLKSKKKHILHNGPIECRLLHYPISDQAPRQKY